MGQQAIDAHGDSLLVDPVTLSEGSQALLTILYCSTAALAL